MNLTPGQQIQNQAQSLYEIGDLVDQTESCLLYMGFRRFLNYKYQERQFYYAARDEWAKVLVKIPLLRGDETEEDLKKIYDIFRYECQSVLARHVVWFPQLIDWIELSRDESNGDGSPKIPAIVFEYPHGMSLPETLSDPSLSDTKRVQMAVHLLDFFESLQNAGQYCHGVSTDEIMTGDHGRLKCTFSERIQPLDQPVSPLTIPDEYLLAPELVEQSSGPSGSTDLWHWAILASVIVGGDNARNELKNVKVKKSFSKPLLKEIQKQFVDAADSDQLILRPLSPKHYQKNARLMVKGLGDLISSCLHPSHEKRPDSIKELRQKAIRAGSGGLRKMFNPFS